MSGKRHPLDILNNAPKLPPKEQKKILRYVRDESGLIHAETKGRVVISEDGRNRWHIAYLGHMTHQNVTTLFVYTFIKGYRSAEGIQFTPMEQRVLAGAVKKIASAALVKFMKRGGK